MERLPSLWTGPFPLTETHSTRRRVRLRTALLWLVERTVGEGKEEKKDEERSRDPDMSSRDLDTRRGTTQRITNNKIVRAMMKEKNASHEQKMM